MAVITTTVSYYHVQFVLMPSGQSDLSAHNYDLPSQYMQACPTVDNIWFIMLIQLIGSLLYVCKWQRNGATNWAQWYTMSRHVPEIVY